MYLGGRGGEVPKEAVAPTAAASSVCPDSNVSLTCSGDIHDLLLKKWGKAWDVQNLDSSCFGKQYLQWHTTRNNNKVAQSP